MPTAYENKGEDSPPWEQHGQVARGSQQRPHRDLGAGRRGPACGEQEEATDLLWSQQASLHPEPQPGALTSLLRKQ